MRLSQREQRNLEVLVDSQTELLTRLGLKDWLGDQSKSVPVEFSWMNWSPIIVMLLNRIEILEKRLEAGDDQQ